MFFNISLKLHDKGWTLNVCVYIYIYYLPVVRFINAYNIFTILSPFSVPVCAPLDGVQIAGAAATFHDFVTRSDESPVVTNDPENRPGPKRKLVFQPSIFRCKLLVSGRAILQAFSFCFLSFNFPNSPPGRLFCARVSFVKSGLTKEKLARATLAQFDTKSHLERCFKISASRKYQYQKNHLKIWGCIFRYRNLMQLFRRFLELTRAILTMLVYPAQVIVPSGMRITFLLSKRIHFFKIHLLQNHFWTSYVKSFGQVNLLSKSSTPQTIRRKPPASHDPQTAHQSGSTQTSGGPRVLKAVSGSLVPPTHQGAQSFFRWVKRSLWVSLCWDLIPKKETNRQVSYSRKGHFFDFTLVGCGSQGCVNSECSMVETWCGLNLLGMNLSAFEGSCSYKAQLPRSLPFFGVGKPLSNHETWQVEHPVFHVELNIQPRVIYAGIFLKFSHVVQQLTTATQKTRCISLSFPPKTQQNRKKTQTFWLSTSTSRLWNLLEALVEMVLGANHHLRTKERNRLHRLGATKTQPILWKFK